LEKINLNEKLVHFSDYWNPRIIGEVNDHHVKLVKFKGEFDWHSHEVEDELFLVLHGSFQMHFVERIVELQEGEMIIVPHGTKHRPVAREEVHCMLFESATTLNTGEKNTDKTRNILERI